MSILTTPFFTRPEPSPRNVARLSAPRLMTKMAFKLSKTSDPYWDGGPPHGKEIFLAITRSMTISCAHRIEREGPYFHDFGMGVKIRIDTFRPKRSFAHYFAHMDQYFQGMDGYEWLVDGIIRFGSAITRDEYFRRIAEKGSENRRRRLGF